jgi:hypothetical protein
MDTNPPNPTFQDGIGKGDLPYRIYSLPAATWLYVEQFTTYANASVFCKAAGGVLSSPKGPEEQQQVAAFLRQTLATNVQHMSTPQADFLLWGSSTDKQVANSDIDANQQALDSTTVVQQCSALGWSWDGTFSLQAHPCGLADDSLAALCRLPPANSSDNLNLPQGKTTLPLNTGLPAASLAYSGFCLDAHSCRPCMTGHHTKSSFCSPCTYCQQHSVSSTAVPLLQL